VREIQEINRARNDDGQSRDAFHLNPYYDPASRVVQQESGAETLHPVTATLEPEGENAAGRPNVDVEIPLPPTAVIGGQTRFSQQATPHLHMSAPHEELPYWLTPQAMQELLHAPGTAMYGALDNTMLVEGPSVIKFLSICVRDMACMELKQLSRQLGVNGVAPTQQLPNTIQYQGVWNMDRATRKLKRKQLDWLRREIELNTVLSCMAMGIGELIPHPQSPGQRMQLQVSMEIPTCARWQLVIQEEPMTLRSGYRFPNNASHAILAGLRQMNQFHPETPIWPVTSSPAPAQAASQEAEVEADNTDTTNRPADLTVRHAAMRTPGRPSTAPNGETYFLSPPAVQQRREDLDMGAGLVGVTLHPVTGQVLATSPYEVNMELDNHATNHGYPPNHMIALGMDAESAQIPHMMALRMLSPQIPPLTTGNRNQLSGVVCPCPPPGASLLLRGTPDLPLQTWVAHWKQYLLALTSSCFRVQNMTAVDTTIQLCVRMMNLIPDKAFLECLWVALWEVLGTATRQTHAPDEVIWNPFNPLGLPSQPLTQLWYARLRLHISNVPQGRILKRRMSWPPSKQELKALKVSSFRDTLE